MVAVAIALPSASRTGAGEHWWRWPNDHVLTDGRYEVRISAAVVTEMRAETRRGARTRGERIEPGGVPLGAFDEAVCPLPTATPPPPPPPHPLAAIFSTPPAHAPPR